MAGALERRDRDLNAEIRADASAFAFVQLVRLLSHGNRSDRALAGAVPASLQFATPATLGFPASEVLGWRSRREGNAERLELIVGFLGLSGPSGALPRVYTEALIERRHHHRDDAMHGFLDIFTHRASALFYSAWRKYQSWMSVEAGERDGFLLQVLSLCGRGLEGVLPDGAEGAAESSLLVEHAGLLSQRPLSVQALLALVEARVGAPVSLQQFVGQWVALPSADQSRLGVGECALGVSALVGGRIWDRQGRVVLRLGPLRRAAFDDLLPGREGARRLAGTLAGALGHAVACDVVLVLDRRDVPRARLGGAASRLGANCWLHGTAPARDPDDMCHRLLH